MQTQVPLTSEDRRLLTCIYQSIDKKQFIGLAFFTGWITLALIPSIALLFMMDSWEYAQGGWLMLIVIVVLGGLVYLMWRHLVRLIRGRRLILRAIDGQAHKRVITGRVTGMAPAPKPGVRYTFDTQHVDVAVAPWNVAMADTATGKRPRATDCRAGSDVVLHLLDLYPGRQPLLLCAKYTGSPKAKTREEAITPDDKQSSRKATHEVRTFVWLMAVAFFAFGLVAGLWPLMLVALIVVGISFIPLPRATAMENMTRKQVVTGTVDEVLAYRLTRGTVHVMHTDTVRSYRIDGELYTVSNEHVDARPGDTVHYSYQERGNGKRQPIFIRTADGKQHELV